MYSAKVKICGIQTLQDIDCLNDAKPDFAGFVFALGRHYVTPSHAHELIEHLCGIQSVGVVVDEPIDKLIDIVQTSKIDILQLHGHESDSYIKELSHRISIPIWKALRMQKVEDVRVCASPPTPLVLLDSFTNNEMGGSGKRFAWEWLVGKDLHNTWIAGGITLDNVKEILSLHPYGVDISSGVECSGRKDAQKIKEIIQEVRAYA